MAHDGCGLFWLYLAASGVVCSSFFVTVLFGLLWNVDFGSSFSSGSLCCCTFRVLLFAFVLLRYRCSTTPSTAKFRHYLLGSARTFSVVVGVVGGGGVVGVV